MSVPTALVHDYLTQRGGAERVVGSMLKVFPGSPVHTSLYEPEMTFPVFGLAEVHPLPINRFKPLRRHHRLALPVLARAFSRLRVDAEVTICSSSGWAHGALTAGRKVVYCHTPARWLYQSDRYFGAQSPAGMRPAVSVLLPYLRSWDANAAQSADRYLVNSTAVAHRVKTIYAIEADVVPPCVTLDPSAPQSPTEGLEPGFWLCVSRLLPYKNVEAVVQAFRLLAGEYLVIAGDGPGLEQLRAASPPNVRLVGRVEDSALAWLYANCRALVAASYEDFGLTPLEANAFGKPAATLRWGGFVDTVAEGVNGLFFGQPTPMEIAHAVRRVDAELWSSARIQEHASLYSEARFIERLRAVVEEERRLL